MSPRTKAQFEEMRKQSKAAILQAAAKMFAKNGYNHTTVDMIAHEAEVSKGLVYNHFTSKQELLGAIVNEGFSHMSALMDSLRQIPNPCDRILVYLNGYKSIRKAKGEDFTRLMLAIVVEPEFPQEIVNNYKQHLELGYKVFAEFFRECGFTQPKEESRLFHALLGGMRIQFYMFKDNYPLEDVVDLLIKKYKKEFDELNASS